MMFIKTTLALSLAIFTLAAPQAQILDCSLLMKLNLGADVLRRWYKFLFYDSILHSWLAPSAQTYQRTRFQGLHAPVFGFGLGRGGGREKGREKDRDHLGKKEMVEVRRHSGCTFRARLDPAARAQVQAQQWLLRRDPLKGVFVSFLDLSPLLFVFNSVKAHFLFFVC
ncbi:hypothetical protein BGW80DRAFT_1445522 [Lactifluus volemus]|nr:hypothetical protein BGW80DRAFT_1445522 [Lactifluus volemus]